MSSVVDEIEAELKRPFMGDQVVWVSPERLAALCRYVRATEVLITAFIQPNATHQDVNEAWMDWKSARAELGLGEE